MLRKLWIKKFPGEWILSSYGGIFEPVGIGLLHEALVNPSMRLRVGWFYGAGQNFQEVRHCNHPPFLRNRFFPKSFHPALGVIGVPNTVATDLEGLDARDG